MPGQTTHVEAEDGVLVEEGRRAQQLAATTDDDDRCPVLAAGAAAVDPLAQEAAHDPEQDEAGATGRRRDEDGGLHAVAAGGEGRQCRHHAGDARDAGELEAADATDAAAVEAGHRADRHAGEDAEGGRSDQPQDTRGVFGICRAQIEDEHGQCPGHGQGDDVRHDQDASQRGRPGRGDPWQLDRPERVLDHPDRASNVGVGRGRARVVVSNSISSPWCRRRSP